LYEDVNSGPTTDPGSYPAETLPQYVYQIPDAGATGVKEYTGTNEYGVKEYTGTKEYGVNE
jgi:hypothetical protein